MLDQYTNFECVFAFLNYILPALNNYKTRKCKDYAYLQCKNAKKKTNCRSNKKQEVIKFNNI